MNSHSSTLTALLLLLTIAQCADAQTDSTVFEKKNAITVSILPILDRTISIAYSRKLRNGKELTFNPRVKFASGTAATEPAYDKGSNHWLFGLVPDPQWYYDHYMIRVGLRMPMNKRLGYEPQLQLAYGQFLNKVIKISDSSGDAYDEYLRLDRKYYSAGIINMFNWVHDYRWLRMKWFAGVGVHVKLYNDTVWNHYTWDRDTSEFYDLSREPYYKGKISLHAGLEIGLRY